jgi:hypothetical protein
VEKAARKGARVVPDVPRTFGNLFGPGVVNVDMSASKTTHLTERMIFEFWIEAYPGLFVNLP